MGRCTDGALAEIIVAIQIWNGVVGDVGVDIRPVAGVDSLVSRLAIPTDAICARCSGRARWAAVLAPDVAEARAGAEAQFTCADEHRQRRRWWAGGVVCALLQEVGIVVPGGGGYAVRPSR
ncbi:hypothetical protein GCM10020218_086450 [Dactylosporangium vinaceum]